MSGRAAGKKVFITGGAQGLGAAMGEALVAEGAKVALADINIDGAKATAAAINAKHGAESAFAFVVFQAESAHAAVAHDDGHIDR